MPSINFCEDCNIEFKIKHDADNDIFKVMYCPFCSASLELDEQYDFDDEEDEE